MSFGCLQSSAGITHKESENTRNEQLPTISEANTNPRGHAEAKKKSKIAKRNKQLPKHPP
jgi:hypothetical protein